MCASYLAVLVLVLLVLDVAAYAWFAGRERDLVEPLLGTPEGRAVYAAALRRIALGLALVDLPVLLVAGAASYALAAISVRPLVAAREREARFAAETAHELRTPLARIAGLAQSGRAAADDAARDNAFARIGALAVDASGTIGDLLALVREEHVAERLAEPVELGALVRAAAEAAGDERVRVDPETSAEYWVLGDARRLRRLADNLVENALRHAGAAVSVAVRSDGRRIALSVADDGPGVAPELRARIFERFVRAAGDERGSGLGLAICRAIARAHGGDVVLEGRNRFVVRLPRLDTDVKGV